MHFLREQGKQETPQFLREKTIHFLREQDKQEQGGQIQEDTSDQNGLPARRQTQKVKAGVLNNALIQSLDWNTTTESLSSGYMDFKATTEAFVSPHINETEWWNTLG